MSISNVHANIALGCQQAFLLKPISTAMIQV